jgi:hypothetical protein
MAFTVGRFSKAGLKPFFVNKNKPRCCATRLADLGIFGRES